MKIKEDNYITIQGWMRTDLDLKGNDLLVYAIIYGFSQDEGHRFKGSLQYLADWCGSSKQGISNNLKRLVESGYLQKFESEKNGIKFCEYSVNTGKNSCMVCNSVERGMQLSLTNNIDNNKDKDFISKDIKYNNTKTHDFEFGKSKEQKQSLYSKCISHIYSFSNSLSVQKYLKDFLDSLIDMKKLRGEKQFIGILDKLKSLSDNAEKQIKIIQYSIERGYATFYEMKDSGYNGSRMISSDIGNHTPQYTKEEKEQIKRGIEDGTAEEF